jgi:hypothetical protein
MNLSPHIAFSLLAAIPPFVLFVMAVRKRRRSQAPFQFAVADLVAVVVLVTPAMALYANATDDTDRRLAVISALLVAAGSWLCAYVREDKPTLRGLLNGGILVLPLVLAISLPHYESPEHNELRREQLPGARVLHAIHDAQTKYRRLNGQYAISLWQLVARGGLDSEIATHADNYGGYRIELLYPENYFESLKHGFGTLATPATYGKTGTNTYFMSAEGFLWQADPGRSIVNQECPACGIHPWPQDEDYGWSPTGQ